MSSIKIKKQKLIHYNDRNNLNYYKQVSKDDEKMIKLLLIQVCSTSNNNILIDDDKCKIHINAVVPALLKDINADSDLKVYVLESLLEVILSFPRKTHIYAIILYMLNIEHENLFKDFLSLLLNHVKNDCKLFIELKLCTKFLAISASIGLIDISDLLEAYDELLNSKDENILYLIVSSLVYVDNVLLKSYEQYEKVNEKVLAIDLNKQQENIMLTLALDSYKSKNDLKNSIYDPLFEQFVDVLNNKDYVLKGSLDLEFNQDCFNNNYEYVNLVDNKDEITCDKFILLDFLYNTLELFNPRGLDFCKTMRDICIKHKNHERFLIQVAGESLLNNLLRLKTINPSLYYQRIATTLTQTFYKDVLYLPEMNEMILNVCLNTYKNVNVQVADDFASFVAYFIQACKIESFPWSKLSTTTTTPYINQILQKLDELTFHGTIGKGLMEEYNITVPEVPECKSTLVGTEIFNELVALIRTKPSDEELISFITSEKSNDEPKLELVVHVAMTLGKPSLTHLNKAFDRCLPMTTKLLLDDKDALLNSVLSYWNCENVVPIIFTSCLTIFVESNLLTDQDILNWMLSNIDKFSIHYWFWEIIKLNIFAKQLNELHQLEYLNTKHEEELLDLEEEFTGNNDDNEELNTLKEKVNEKIQQNETNVKLLNDNYELLKNQFTNACTKKYKDRLEYFQVKYFL